MPLSFCIYTHMYEYTSVYIYKYTYSLYSLYVYVSLISFMSLSIICSVFHTFKYQLRLTDYISRQYNMEFSVVIISTRGLPHRFTEQIIIYSPKYRFILRYFICIRSDYSCPNLILYICMYDS